MDEQGRQSPIGSIVLHEAGELDPVAFRAAVQMTRMPIVLADPNLEDCPIVYCNDAFCSLTGYSRDEILGRNCRFLQGVGTDPDTVQRISRAITSRECVEVEILNYRKDGSCIWVRVQVSPVFDDNGALRFFFGSQIDVTREREAEARQARQIESIGSLSSGVAHEFNNLMVVVVGSLEQVLKSIADPAQRRRLERADWAAKRAGRQAAQLLEITRRQAEELKVVDVNQVLRDLESTMARAAGPDVCVTLNLAGSPVRVRLDPEELRRVLLSLARNAVDATAPGGRVTVGSALTSGHGGVMQVELAVHDTGRGMPSAVAERATEAFFTTKGGQDATGLGLFLALRFAEQAGGSLTIETQPGRGTTVRLRLPLHA